MIFDKHFYILRRKSTHIYDKMYNFITLKKKKTFSVGRLFTVGRTWTIKQLIFFGLRMHVSYHLVVGSNRMRAKLLCFYRQDVYS